MEVPAIPRPSVIWKDHLQKFHSSPSNTTPDLLLMACNLFWTTMVKRSSKQIKDAMLLPAPSPLDKIESTRFWCLGILLTSVDSHSTTRTAPQPQLEFSKDPPIPLSTF